MFIVICVIWGSNFILMKWAYTAFGPIGVGAGRVLGGAGVLWVFWALSKKQGSGGLRGLSRGDWLALSVPVVLGSIYPYIMQPYLIGKHQDSAFFGMMVCLVPAP
ncbi:MAG: EamA family transporter [Phycisphaerales bacterium]